MYSYKLGVILREILDYNYCISFLETDAWLAGVLTTGELFLWNKDQDCLKTVQAAEKPKKMIQAAVGGNFLFV